VSCARPGDCAAGGSYFGADAYEAFVVTQTGGRWRTATEVPGLRFLNSAGDAAVSSISCPAPGDCSAGGLYENGRGNHEALVVTESKGRWGQAAEVPRSGDLNIGGQAEVESVSCARPGDCSAGGYYTPRNVNTTQAFVVTERSGHWGAAIEVLGPASLRVGGQAEVESVSCARPGDCSAGGFYQDTNMNTQALVVSETSAGWGKAIVVPGSAHLNGGGYAQVNSVSCAAVGRCSAVGNYTAPGQEFSQQAFVVTES
jgi:hypothetical protein